MRPGARPVMLGLVMAAVLAMGGCDPVAGFLPDTVLPEEREVLAQVDHGQAGREVMAAVFHGDRETVRRMLTADPRLLATQGGQDTTLVAAAIARRDQPMVELLLSLHAPVNTPVRDPPIGLALRATTPWYAERLLEAGASPNPLADDSLIWPLEYATKLSSLGAVMLLVQHGADINVTEDTGSNALQTAIDTDSFRIAEYLLAHGANVWAVSSNGHSIGDIYYQPIIIEAVGERAAQARVIAALRARGYPWPPPNSDAVRRLVLNGQWPPEAARRAGAPPVDSRVLATMREFHNPDGSEKPR